MLVNSILSLAFVAFVFCTPETTSAEQIEKRADVNGLNKRDHLDLLAARLDGDEADKRSYYRPSYGYGNRYYKRDEVEKRSYYRPSYGYGNRYYKRDEADESDEARREDDGEVDKRGYYHSSYGYGNRYYKRDEADKRSYYRPSYGYGNRYYKRDEVEKRSYYRPSYGYGNHYYKRDEADESDEASREDDIDLSKRFYYGFVPYKRSEDGNEMSKRDGYYRPHYGYGFGNRYYKRDESDEAKREDGGNVDKRSYYRPSYGRYY